MTREEIKEQYTSVLTFVQSLPAIDNNFKIDSALTVKEIHKTIPGSITRSLATILSTDVLLTPEEITGVEMICKIIESTDSIRPHEYILINSLTRRIKNSERMSVRRCDIVINTQPTHLEIQSLLDTKGLDVYHSIVNLYLAIMIGVRQEFIRKG